MKTNFDFINKKQRNSFAKLFSIIVVTLFHEIKNTHLKSFLGQENFLKSIAQLSIIFKIFL